MICEGRVVESDIKIEEILREVMKNTAQKGDGALVLFIGYVKGLVEGHKVHELRYEAYEPYASKMLRDIACSIAKKYSLNYVLVLHRVGILRPGDPSIYIVVTANSRHTAYEASREILEQVKSRVPIFKLEKRDDGEYWVVGDGRRIPRRRRGDD